MPQRTGLIRYMRSLHMEVLTALKLFISNVLYAQQITRGHSRLWPSFWQAESLTIPQRPHCSRLLYLVPSCHPPPHVSTPGTPSWNIPKKPPSPGPALTPAGSSPCLLFVKVTWDPRECLNQGVQLTQLHETEVHLFKMIMIYLKRNNVYACETYKQYYRKE